MTWIVVAGEASGAGATTVAVGLAHRLAYAGHAVRLERLVAPGGNDARATGDAATFTTIDFATASGAPRTLDQLRGNEPRDDEDVTIVEAPAGIDAASLAKQLGGRLVLVGAAGGSTPGGSTPGDSAPDDALAITNHALQPSALALPEDRVLAAPTVGALIEASGARVLVRSTEGEAAICEHVLVGPIAADSDEPYFRRFPRKAVVTRAEKVDVALSALRTDTVCLVLSGGDEPSPYILDRVGSARDTTLLLAPQGTVETVRDIEGAFGKSPFSGPLKAERAGELMAAALSDEAVAALLAS